MTSHPERLPSGDEAETRWSRLGFGRRIALTVGGEEPSGPEEAVTALAFARRMEEPNPLWALLTAVGAFVVVVALELLVQTTLTAGSWVLAAGVAVGVGLGIGVGGRRQARRLASRAERVLAEEG